MRNNRKQVVFADSISVRTKVSPAGTITVTVMNDTTMETLTHVFSFKSILSSNKEQDSKEEKDIDAEVKVDSSEVEAEDEEKIDPDAEDQEDDSTGSEV